MGVISELVLANMISVMKSISSIALILAIGNIVFKSHDFYGVLFSYRRSGCGCDL